jgi:CIC family chloride channel protein
LKESFGSLIHLVFPAVPISTGAYALVGMGAVFAGSAQAPISVILILFEMTGDYKILLPLMITCVISTLVVKRFSRESIYTLKLRRRGIDILNIKKHDLLDKILVSKAMFKTITTVNETTTVREAVLKIKSTTHRGFPVLDTGGKLTGIITYNDINKALNTGKGDDLVGNFMTRDMILCYPEDTLKTALEKLGARNIGHLPVVEKSDNTRLLGLITRKSIIAALNQELKKEKEEDKEGIE